MGYLNKSTITVDAILTKKGRELLAQGTDQFKVTKFAVADDEVDYGLYDVAHPLGTEYYGNSIERMPIVEASPDETQNLRYKLVSYDRGRSTIPQITNLPSSITKTYTAQLISETLKPVTIGFDGPTFGYTAILYDRNVISLAVSVPVPGQNATPSFLGNLASTTAVVLVGNEFTITPVDVSSTRTTQIRFVGNQSGATATVSITVNPGS